MGLKEAIQSIWSSDYVQKNPNKAYKVTYDDEYLAVATYINGGAEPNWSNFSKLGKGLCEVEKERRAAAGPTGPTGATGATGPTGSTGATGSEPGEYLWDAPTLSNPLVKTLSNAAPSVAKGSGQDLKVVFGGDLDRQVGQIEGYNDVVVEKPRIIGGTELSQGHIIPRENTGTFYVHDGRLELDTKWTSDALVSRWRTPVVRFVNLHISVTCGVRDGSGNWSRPADPHHADGFQTQQAMIGELGFDCCTIVTDYQGIFQSNEPSTLAGQRSRVDKTIMSRILFRPGKVGYPATWWFKAFPVRGDVDPVGATEMYDVWAPLQDILAHVYPNGHTWRGWDGSNNKYGAFLETKLHPKLNKQMPFCRFSTTADKVPAGKPLAGQTCGDVGVRGDGGIWCYQNLSEVPAYVGSKGV